MKKLLSAALFLLALVITLPALADRDRGYYGKHRDYHSSYYSDRKGYSHKGKSHKGYDRRVYVYPRSYTSHHYYAPHPRYYRGGDRVIVHRDYRRDNTLEILGGIYLLNEILHHPHHHGRR